MVSEQRLQQFLKFLSMLLVLEVRVSIFIRMAVFLLHFLFLALLFHSLLLVARGIGDLDDCQYEYRYGFEPIVGVDFLLEVEED